MRNGLISTTATSAPRLARDHRDERADRAAAEHEHAVARFTPARSTSCVATASGSITAA